jgi:IclR family mhp operon transcriptional activator
MKSIRALERGLEVLRLLSQYEGRSLQALHEASGLPKATLLRILHTLEQSGLAWRAIYDGEWRRGRAWRHTGWRQAWNSLSWIVSGVVVTG